MATFQRQIGWRAVRHGVVESTIHKEDVALNNERRGRYWLGVEVQPEDGHHEIPQLGGGLYFVRDQKTGKLDELNGDKFIAAMDAWTAEKSWYYREIEDAKCKGGPWSCAVLRQGEQGFIPQDSTNYRTARRLYERNEKRTGEPPLDWAMCNAVDLLCQGMFGFSPRLKFWRQVYMQGLPELSFNRLLALHDAVGREVQVWQKFAARSRDYVPSGFNFGRSVNGGKEVLLK